MSRPEHLTIIGAGPVGTLLALYFAGRGFSIDLFEKREDLLLHQMTEGRSINLALSARGLHALKEVGLDQALLKHAVQMKGRMIHPRKGSPYFIPYSPHQSHVIYSISRVELTKLLLQETDAFPQITVRFNEECLGVDLKTQHLQFRNSATNRRHQRPFSLLFDAEGIGSAVRTALLKQPYTNFHQEYLNYDYKELTIPPLKGGYQLPKEALHLWPRGRHLMIALPNPDGSFTCTLFLPRLENPTFLSLDNPKKVIQFFENEFPDVFPLIDDLTVQFFKRPIGYLATVKIAPWSFQGKILLIGDAAHGIVPFYGQGLNCGFEDCSFLNSCFDRHPGDWQSIFHDYEQGRKKNTDAIAELSFDNFVELREKVADPKFILKRELEARLEAAYPHEFMSKYSMVTFSLLPYEEALIRGRRQDEILMDACSGINSIDQLNLSEIKERLFPHTHN